MSEWYADEKPSGKPYVPETGPAEYEDPLAMTEMRKKQCAQSPSLPLAPVVFRSGSSRPEGLPPSRAARRPAHAQLRCRPGRPPVSCGPPARAEDGDITPAEISALSRAGYGRTDGDGRFFADEEKMSGSTVKVAPPKPNNVSVRCTSGPPRCPPAPEAARQEKPRARTTGASRLNEPRSPSCFRHGGFFRRSPTR